MPHGCCLQEGRKRRAGCSQRNLQSPDRFLLRLQGSPWLGTISPFPLSAEAWKHSEEPRAPAPSLPAPSSRRGDPPARQPFYLHHAACWQLPPLALLKNPAGHAHSRAHGGPICRTSPCTARKTSGSARCQVCCCPAAALVREGDVPAGEGLSPVPMHTPGDSPPVPIPSRSPTISPTGLPASSPLRRSTPCPGAAASRRTPPFPGARAPTPRQTPARGQLLVGGC